MKKISEKDRKLSGADMSENGFTLRFRSGGEYEITKDAYMDGLKRQFDLPFGGIGKMITESRNERLKASAGNRPPPRYPPCMAYIYDRRAVKDGEEDETLSAIGEKAWREFREKWGDLFMSENDDILDIAGSGGMLEDDFMRWSYTQDGRCLSAAKPGIDVYVSRSGQPRAWYTRHEIKNGFEIWYKAVDPFAWFGKKKRTKHEKV